MIDTDNIRKYVVAGLAKYLGVEVIRSNQNATPPKYPYLVYTVTTLESQNNGTYGEYADGTERKAVTQTWSISAVASTNTESVTLIAKAKEYLERVGTTYLNDNDVIVQSCTAITNRDNVLSVEYEYKNGFDVVFWCMTEISGETADLIESVEINNTEISKEDDDKHEHYKGSYSVTPKTSEQTLETENKILDDNITVLSIPYYEVSNTDGTTVIIGGQ